MSNMHIKKGDTVVVNTGVDKGNKGKVMTAMPKDNKVIVEGVNIRTKHVKARKAGEQGGIVKSEGAINASNVNLLCPKCDKITRTAYSVDKKGNKIRVCKKCGAEIK